jgi:hypothetical protein
MTEFKNVHVYNLKESVIACRNAMRLTQPELNDEQFEEEFNKSLDRAIKLAKLGGSTGHTSFRKGILVSFDMKYPLYISKQMQRYHWFEYVASNSTMHKLLQMDMDKSFNKYVLPQSKEIMKDLIRNYNSIPETSPELKYEAFMKVVSNCPQGLELFVHITTNYEQLATMYKQRKHHKLKEDWGAFCEMVESLPYADELIICTEPPI